MTSIGHYLTRAQAARRLHTSARRLVQMAGLPRVNGRFAVEEVYPGFLFVRSELLDEFRWVVEELGDLPDLEIIGWFHEPRHELGGKTPAMWMLEGHDPERVHALAAA